MEEIKYSICIDDLLLLKKNLEQNQKCNSNDILLVNMLIQNLQNKWDKENDLSVISSLKEQAIYKNIFNDEEKLVYKFLHSGLFISDDPAVKYDEFLISNQDTIELAQVFFREQGSFFYKAFENFLSIASSHMQFIAPNNYTDGLIYFIDATKEPFVILPNHPNFTKVTIAIHEFEHVIDCLNNPSFYHNTLIREASALFMEILACDFVKEVLDLDVEPDARRFFIHTIIKTECTHLFYKNQLLNLILKYKKQSNRYIKKKLNKVGYSNYFVKYSADTNLVNNYYYPISQMIAIELFTIYEQDKNMALNILKDIIMNGTDQNIYRLLQKYNIVLTENVEKYEENLCLKLGI